MTSKSLIDAVLDPVVCQQLFLCLLHFLWQATIIGLAAMLATKLLRGYSSQFRYRVNLVLLVLIACCMPLTYLNQSSRLIDVPVTTEVVADSNRSNQNTHVAQASKTAIPKQSVEPDLNSPAPSTNPIVAGDATKSSVEQYNVIRMPSHRASLAKTFVSLWGIGIFVMLLRLGVSTSAAFRIRKNSTPVAIGEWESLFHAEATRLGLRRTPLVAWCQQVSAPVVVGCFKPIVLLPPALASGLSIKEMELVLAHEFAHIRRLDPLVNMIQRAIESIFFFHPAVWYVSRLTSIERENCCDDMVLSSGAKRLELAEVLLRAAEVCLSSSPQAYGLSFLGQSGSVLKSRVLRLVRPVRPIRFGGSTLLLIFALMLSLFSHFQLQKSLEAMNLQSNSQEKNAAALIGAENAGDLLAVLGGGPGRIWGLAQKIEEANGRIWITESNGYVTAFDAKTLERLGSFQAHPNRCLDLALFADGRQMVTVAIDGSARLWDLSTERPKLVDSFQVEEKSESSWIKMSASASQRLVVVRGESQIALLDVHAGKLEKRDNFPFQAKGGIPSNFALSPDGKWLVICRDLETGERVETKGEGFFVFSDAELSVWDVANWTPRLKSKTQTKAVSELTFMSSPTGDGAVEGEFELLARSPVFLPKRNVRAWKFKAGELQPLKSIPIETNSWAPPAASDDGKTIAMAKDKQVILLRRNRDSWQKTATLDTGRVFSAKVLTDGAVITTSQIRLQRWEATNDGFVSTTKRSVGHENNVSGLLFDTRRESLLTSSTDSLHEWNLSDRSSASHQASLQFRGISNLYPLPNRAGFLIRGNDADGNFVQAVRRNSSGKTVSRFKIEFGEDYRKNSWSAAMHPTKDLLVTGHWDHHIRVWDVSDIPAEICSWKAVQGHVCDVEFSPDGKLLAVAGWDKSTQLWRFDEASIRKGEKPTGDTIGEHADIVREVAFSQDGRFLASGGEDGQILLWDLKAGDLTPKSLMYPGEVPTRNALDSNTVGGLQFSKDSSELLSGDGKGRVTIWSVKTLKMMKKWRLPGWVWHVAYSPDEKIVATANGDGTICLFKR